ncbi:hypothetical protein PG997_002000 [Apiospora hydei]|uniref:Adenosine deaminase domain-containing protein n=1 Tax=Apiospora hydei TaxID=1337664 RepID=A0ABR1X889_9PEZI
MNGLQISPFITSLPKVELHVHIEGTLTPSLRWKLAQRNRIPLPYATYADLLESYNVLYNHRKELHGDTGAPTFLETYFAGTQVLCEEDDFYELGMAYLEKAADMNVRYAEPFFDLQAYLPHGIPAATVLNGYMRAQREGAQKFGVRSNWILCFIRDRPVEEGIAAYEGGAALGGRDNGGSWAVSRGGAG